MDEILRFHIPSHVFEPFQLPKRPKNHPQLLRSSASFKGVKHPQAARRKELLPASVMHMGHYLHSWNLDFYQWKTQGSIIKWSLAGENFYISCTNSIITNSTNLVQFVADILRFGKSVSVQKLTPRNTCRAKNCHHFATSHLEEFMVKCGCSLVGLCFRVVDLRGGCKFYPNSNGKEFEKSKSNNKNYINVFVDLAQFCNHNHYQVLQVVYQDTWDKM